MKKFYPKNTVQAPEWCPRCGRETPWRILNGRPAFCLNFHDKPHTEDKPEPKVEQPGLFDATKA